MLSRRKKLIVRSAVITVLLLTAVSVAILLTLPKSKRYTPGETPEGIISELERNLPPGYPKVQFKDTTRKAGIDFIHFHGTRSTQLPEDMGSGAAWGDYDNDGDPDLFLCNLAGPLTMADHEIQQSPAANRLYRNNGNGAFTDVTAVSGLDDHGWSMGAAWGDSDGDGWLDLFVSNYGMNKLYRNRKDGTFEDVTQKAGIGNDRGFWTGVSWSDYDLDGDMDVYVCGYVKYTFRPEDRNRTAGQYKTVVPFTLNPSSYEPERNLLFRNNGDGSFHEVAEEAGVSNTAGRSLSAAWCDFNKDGHPDLYVANDISDNAMFMNQGDGTFTDVAESSWVADYRGAMGLAAGDWNNDGDMDIFITHWIAQENAMFDNLLIPMGPQNGFPRFSDIADRIGLGQIALDYIGWGTSFFDYDNDSRRDLFVVNGSTFQEESNPEHLIPMKNLLFWNQGEDGYYETGSVSGEVFARKAVGRGAAFADFDLDGDVDVVVVNHSSAPLLLQNEGGNRNHWLRVRAQGKRNRFGIGARVEVVTAGGRKQIDEIGAQSSYLSQNDSTAWFGLGNLSHAEQVFVRFPGGKIVELQDVAANQTLTVAEE